ncbi:hypothetical protein AALO_G00136680, partial [Alosa alosa]
HRQKTHRNHVLRPRSYEWLIASASALTLRVLSQVLSPPPPSTHTHTHTQRDYEQNTMKRHPEPQTCPNSNLVQWGESMMTHISWNKEEEVISQTTV